MFNKKNIAIGIVALIIVIIAFRKKPNSGGNQNLQNLAPGPSGTPTAPKSTKTTCTGSTILKRGMNCSEVARAQKIINVYYKFLGIAEIQVDGVFGGDTETGFYDILYKPTGSANELYNGVEKLIKKQ